MSPKDTPSSKLRECAEVYREPALLCVSWSHANGVSTPLFKLTSSSVWTEWTWNLNPSNKTKTIINNIGCYFTGMCKEQPWCSVVVRVHPQVLGLNELCSGKLKKCLGSSSLQTLVIYSKCDTHPSVRYLIREEKKRLGKSLQASIGN